jgi:hypothetical protein
MARKALRGDVPVRSVPDGCAAPEDDRLGRLVLHTGSRRDLLGQGALGENVHEIGDGIRVCLQISFDLVQGRHADGSRGAVFVEQRMLCRKEGLHILVVHDPLHRFSRRATPRFDTRCANGYDCRSTSP